MVALLKRLAYFSALAFLAVASLFPARAVFADDCAWEFWGADCKTERTCTETCEPCTSGAVIHAWINCSNTFPTGKEDCGPFQLMRCATTFDCLVDTDNVCGVQNGDPEQPIYYCKMSTAPVQDHMTVGSRVDMTSMDCQLGI